MLFHSSLRKELARSFGATSVVLVTIVMTMMLIRTLGQASQGSVNPSEVSLVMGYTMLGHLPTVLTMSLFIATVGTLSRLYLDSEMVIWLASGKGLRAFLSPVLHFAWPMLVTVAVLVLLVWPWSNSQISELRERFERRGDLERVSPGLFQESSSGQRVFFVDKDSVENKKGKNVFISSTDHGKQAMTSAQGGQIELIDGERFLMLDRGQRVEQTVGEPDLKISEFKVYGSRIGKDVKVAADAPPKALSTLRLIQQPIPSYLGELSWRLGMALAAINLLVVALAVTSANPRVGRGGNLALALFIFVVYYNFINLGQSWIGAGKVQWVPYVLGLHGGMLCLSLMWLNIRHNNWSWRQLLGPRRRQEASA
ncbi:LPS export ABC transporter permease LptF [Limnohabitans sp. JirII-29]|uniref:LPS export ABC transporter permease LptF n=1 Tax=unclassified Limnohabitans TaxID=2626134 RepID=UPI000C1E2F30|nr:MULTISPECIES: LPS export ABC transporter permease LptF [unclassified Limnohabitans]PIT80799.1 LPS export ABC transporter permease LptF [Limnohabitans sp. JirII-31]PUE26529.1 LPS export ABC transporter permease LptF [Limnohabitans sp. JirII-29]